MELIQLTIDGMSLDIAECFHHAQEEPYPGGSSYEMHIAEPEIVGFLKNQCPLGVATDLDYQKANQIFNYIHAVTSAKHGKEPPKFFLNTIKVMKVRPNEILLYGECSPVSSPLK